MEPQPSPKYLGTVCFPFHFPSSSVCQYLGSMMMYSAASCPESLHFTYLLSPFPFIYIGAKHCVMLCRREAKWGEMAPCFAKGFCLASVFLHVSMSIDDCVTQQPWLSKAACHCNDSQCLLLPMALTETNSLLHQAFRMLQAKLFWEVKNLYNIFSRALILWWFYFCFLCCYQLYFLALVWNTFSLPKCQSCSQNGAGFITAIE